MSLQREPVNDCELKIFAKGLTRLGILCEAMPVTIQTSKQKDRMEKGCASSCATNVQAKMSIEI